MDGKPVSIGSAVLVINRFLCGGIPTSICNLVLVMDGHSQIWRGNPSSIVDSDKAEGILFYHKTMCWSDTHMSRVMMLGHKIAYSNPIPIPSETNFYSQNLPPK